MTIWLLLAIRRLLTVWCLAGGRLGSVLRGLLAVLLSRGRLAISRILLRGVLPLLALWRIRWLPTRRRVALLRVAVLLGSAWRRSSTRGAGRGIIALAAGRWGRCVVAVGRLLRVHSGCQCASSGVVYVKQGSDDKGE